MIDLIMKMFILENLTKDRTHNLLLFKRNTKYASVWVSEWVSEWVSGWVSEYVSAWVREYICGWACEKVCVSHYLRM